MNSIRISLPVAALVIVGAIAMSAGSADASGRVLAMHFEGDSLTQAQRDDLTRSLRAALGRYPDIEVVLPGGGDLTDEMIELECVDIDLSCLTRLAKKYAVDRVFYAQADSDGRVKQVLRVKAVDARGAALLRDSRVEVASASGLAAALEAEIAAVFGPVSAPATTGTLVVKTNVPGATIYLGAEVIGTGEATVTRPAGDYVVRVTRDGYDERIEKVTVVAGRTTERAIGLAMSSVTPPPPRKKIDDDDDDSSWALWAVVGAALVGGTIAVVVATRSSDEGGARAPVVFSIDSSNAWRDASVRGGRP